MSKNTSKVFILATVLLPLLGAPAIAFSLDPKTVAYINHIVECATWLAQGDARYERDCVPSRVTKEQLDDLINFGGIVMTSPATSRALPSCAPYCSGS